MKKRNGMSMISMLFALIIIGILIVMVVPKYLEIYKGTTSQVMDGQSKNPENIKKSLEEKVKKINRITKQRSQNY